MTRTGPSGELAAQRLAEAAQAELARAVGGAARVAEVAEDRADVDDRRRAAADARTGSSAARAASARGGWSRRCARSLRRSGRQASAKSLVPAQLTSRFDCRRCRARLAHGAHGPACGRDVGGDAPRPVACRRELARELVQARGDRARRAAALSQSGASARGDRAADAAGRADQHAHDSEAGSCDASATRSVVDARKRAEHVARRAGRPSSRRARPLPDRRRASSRFTSVGEEADVLPVDLAVRAQVAKRRRAAGRAPARSHAAACEASAALVPSSTCTMPKKPTGLRRAM